MKWPRIRSIVFVVLACLVLLSAVSGCSRSVIAIGPSAQARASLSDERILAEIAGMARRNAPWATLMWRKRTRTGWLFVWTRARKDAVKKSIRANPNLMLWQGERSIFPLDDLVLFFSPDIRTVRWMGLGKGMSEAATRPPDAHSPSNPRSPLRYSTNWQSSSFQKSHEWMRGEIS